MKIIIAPDSFKGSLQAIEAAHAIKRGINKHNPAFQTILLPVADGGEGTMTSLIDATDGEIVKATVTNPVGRTIEARYGILGNKQTAVIESAEASGLLLLTENEMNPIHTTSFGTGELIVDALNKGIRQFIIGLGGSATNDAGAGILEALGVKLLNKKGQALPRGGGTLINLHEINTEMIDERLKNCQFLIASDVMNPLVGENGASVVFGPQKGASTEDVKRLDQSLVNFANIVEKSTGIQIHQKNGAGAAGGIGGMFQAFFQSTMEPGIDVVLDTMSFKKHILDADLIITGEGKTDAQTISGKAPFGIAQLAHEHEIPVILISGMIDLNDYALLTPYFTEIHAIVNETIGVEQAINHAAQYLQCKTEEVMKEYMSNTKTESS